MYPFIRIAGNNLSTYALMALVGALIAGGFAEHQAVKRGAHPFYMIEVLLYGAVGVFLGGHLLYGLVHIKELKDGFLQAFGGQVFYGGLLGALAVGAIVIKRKGYPKALYYDVSATASPLFHGFARIGCFLVGCCYGVESEHGFTYTQALIHSANGVNRFPVQLLEAGLNFVLFGILYALLRKGRCAGSLLYIYLSCYAVIRFGLEFLRGDYALRGMWLGLSTSQWISAAIIAAVLVRTAYKKMAS